MTAPHGYMWPDHAGPAPRDAPHALDLRWCFGRLVSRRRGVHLPHSGDRDLRQSEDQTSLGLL